MKKMHLVFAFTLSLLFGGNCFADESPSNLLFPETRADLAEKGLTFESVLAADYVDNMHGGLKERSQWLFSHDLTSTLDTEKAGLWEHGTAFVYFLTVMGNNPTSVVGDIQGTDNIEAEDTWRVMEAWYDHGFLDGKLSVLFGLHDMNSEFSVLSYAQTLLNSSFGIGLDISQVGPSIYPETSPGARLKVLPIENTYMLLAAYDGLPGSEKHLHGTQVHYSADDGLFSIAEAGLLDGEHEESTYKLGAGGWYHTLKYDDFQGEPRDNNRGFYLIGQHKLECGSLCGENLGAFFQLGYAQPDRNQVGGYFGMGFSYQGLIPGRESDTFSFGVASARISRDYRRDFENTAHSETAFDITYLISLTPFLSVQPDFQIVKNPGGDSTVEDAYVGTVRMQLAM